VPSRDEVEGRPRSITPETRNLCCIDAHANLTCETCHKQPAKIVKPPMECFGCHAETIRTAVNSARRAVPVTARRRWLKEVRFDHDLARFPLLGKHHTATCDACHESKAFLDAKAAVQSTAIARTTCTRSASGASARPATTRCLACLAIRSRSTDLVSLERQTPRRRLHACHREKVDGAIKLDSTCASCHRKDDVHDGEFGRDCKQCIRRSRSAS